MSTALQTPKTSFSLPRSHCGQATIELLLSLPVFVSSALALLFTFYYAYSFFHLRFELQEALLCLHREKSSHLCQVEFHRRISEFLPIGELEKVLVEKQSQKLIGAASFSLWSGIRVSEVQELPLPLIPVKN